MEKPEYKKPKSGTEKEKVREKSLESANIDQYPILENKKIKQYYYNFELKKQISVNA